MARVGLTKGEAIIYLGHPYEVVEVYPYLAGLKSMREHTGWQLNDGVIYVGIGDLVISGLGDRIIGEGMSDPRDFKPKPKKQTAVSA